jgi:hypothetical protein
MSYDVRTKHSELIALLSEQYAVYVDARSAFLRTDWDRKREKYEREKDTVIDDDSIELTLRSIREDFDWEASNEDKRKMDESAMKLHAAIKHVVKHYTYWHSGRIRAASGIRHFDWFMLMTPLCLSDTLSSFLEGSSEMDDWKQAIDLADNFTPEEIRGMSGKKYAYELFKRTNRLIDLKCTQPVS